MALMIIIRCDKCNKDITNNYNEFRIYKHTDPNQILYPDERYKPLESQDFFFCDDCLNQILYPLYPEFQEPNDNLEY